MYDVNCAGCHGKDGRGDGPAAPYLFPKPRDFSRGLFKMISSEKSSLPTEADLLRVIAEGMPGSAMPSWELLKKNDLQAIARYIKTLIKYWDEDEEEWLNLFEVQGEPVPLKIPAVPPATAERIARGQLLFREVECWKCHGDTGKGDGPTAPTLRDSWNNPILPRDFTAGIFKGGLRPVDVYLRITLGIPGTPMPGHGVLTESQRWDLTYYVLSLIRPGAQKLNRQRRKTITVKRTKGKLPDAPDDKAWQEIEPTHVALMPLWWRH
ncbi:MAG: cytochrome c, partial [Planctomycetota bacterium]|nr:cytochrome c [Planctomycetota bacterium]